MRRSMFASLFVLLTLACVLTPAAHGTQTTATATSGSVEVGSLALRADLKVTGAQVSCPAGQSESVACYDRNGSGTVPGLGRVSETYRYLLDKAGCLGLTDDHILPTTARFTVAGKGTIDFAVDGLAQCVVGFDPPPLQYTVTGGTGAYVGASGSGTFDTGGRLTGPGALTGLDTWTGTLVVPGLDFNLTAPTLRGVRAKVVRVPKGVKRIRVAYTVTAEDDLDGRIRVSCMPKSGSRFALGRTKVTCSATDSSGNTSTGSFVVTVKRRGT
jgi:hypothetical protein